MIVNNIAYWRSTKMQGKGISKSHLAHRIGVTRSFVTKLEKGAAQPGAELMLRIAAYFQQPVEAIFTRVENCSKFEGAMSTLSMPTSQFSQSLSCPSSGNQTTEGQIVGKSNGEGRGAPVAQ